MLILSPKLNNVASSSSCCNPAGAANEQTKHKKAPIDGAGEPASICGHEEILDTHNLGEHVR